MLNRGSEYESAFQDFLRVKRIPYVPVDQAKKSAFAGAHIKSFDVLVYPRSGGGLLVDVKGRKFPYQHGKTRRFWENWVTQEDVTGLEQWEEVFGRGFRGCFVFVYLITDPASAEKLEVIHNFGTNRYGLVGIARDLYSAHMRPRSPSWRTVSMPTTDFRRYAKPVTAML